MFDIGFSEITLIGIIALIVVGPERLPGLAKTAGIYVRKARQMVSSVRAEVERELEVEELKKQFNDSGALEEVKKLGDDIGSIGKKASGDLNELKSGFESMGKDIQRDAEENEMTEVGGIESELKPETLEQLNEEPEAEKLTK